MDVITMFVESINDVLFLVDFFTIILPALTQSGLHSSYESAVPASTGNQNEQMNIRRSFKLTEQTSYYYISSHYNLDT